MSSGRDISILGEIRDMNDMNDIKNITCLTIDDVGHWVMLLL